MTAETIVGNARRLAKDAFPTAIALDLVAPVEGRTWLAICCWCLEGRDPWTPHAHHVADAAAGWCQCCPYSGRDTLVAAVMRKPLA